MDKKAFKKLTPEQIGALQGADLEAYNAWAQSAEGQKHLAAVAAKAAAPAAGSSDQPAAAAPVAAPAPSVNMKKAAERYFEDNQDGLINEILVVSDGEIFPDTQKGKNHCTNYVSGKKQLGVDLVVSAHKR